MSRPIATTRPIVPSGARPLLVALCCLAAAVAGLASTRDTNGLAALWPPDAMLLAVLLLRPKGAWRYVAWCGCAAFAANIWFGATPMESLLFSSASMAGVVAGAAAGRALGVGPSAFDRPAAVIRFCVTAFVAAMVGAVLAAVAVMAMGGPGGTVWAAWLLSDLLGMIVLTPLGLMLAWARRGDLPAVVERPRETIALLATVLLVTCAVFYQSRYPLLFLPVAPMMAVAYRLGPAGTAAGIIVIAAIGGAATLGGSGPVALAAGSTAIKVHFLQFYLATLFGICSPMAAALAHRDRLAEAVRASEARHRRIVERLHTVIFETDAVGRWTFLSPAWRGLTGRDPVASLGETMLAAVMPGERRKLIAALQPLAHGAAETSCEVRYRDADNLSRWALVTSFPLSDAANGVPGYHGTIEDVTERRAARIAIAESERRYRLLADNASDLILRVGLDGRVRYASPASTRLLGLAPEAMVGRTLLAGVMDEDQDRLREACTALLQGAPEQTCTYRQTGADGARPWLEAAIQLLRDERGRPAEFIAAVRDISRRKAAEEQTETAMARAHESLRLLGMAGSVARLGHWRIDTVASTLMWSDEIFRLHGVNGPTPPPLTQAIEFYHPDDRAMVAEKVERALRHGSPFQFTARLLGADGKTRHVLSSGQAERSACGEVTGLFGVIQDVTERMLAEIELRASEERFRAITEQAGDMITLHDTEGEALFVSPSAQTILGRDPVRDLGASMLDWVFGDDRSILEEMRERLREDAPDQSTPIGRVRMPRAAGGIAWVEVRARATEIAGQPRIVAVWRDVTDQVEREAELGAARAQAEAALRAKAEFLANMSHEIRTPMNGVMGFTELLLGTALDDEQRRHAQLIADSGEAMMKLLNDILDLSKIEAGRLDVACAPIDLSHTLGGCARLLSAAAEQKGLTLALDLAPDLPRAILGDALRIRQVVLNLLGNAVKFTAEGGVTLSARRVGDRLAVTVTDTGIGIAPERQDVIFEQFVQADDSITRAYGGTGLGLAIGNRLARLMGGGLSLDSQPGHGTAITLDLPLIEADAAAVPQRAAPPAPRRAPGRAAHILLADDHDINQVLVTAMLARAGHRVTIAADGAEAVARVAAARGAGTPFDLVLMDMQMPVMDGLTAARTIRAQTDDGPRLPIVALTANAFATDLDACRAAGMDDHLAKPIASDRLLAAIERWVPAVRATPRGRYAPNPALAARFAEQKATTLDAVAALIRSGGLAGSGLEDLAELLHKLAGTAAMFGEADLGDRARDLETGLRGDADAATIQAAARRVCDAA